MDYVEGDSLSGLQRRARQAGVELPAPVAIRILVDALAGLHAAHELKDDAGRPLGIVHRDVSPHNILVGIDGMSRLADFGIAKVSSGVGRTQSGLVKGKIGYMSPEQARAKPLDRRTDVWSAGVIAWEVLAGRRLHTSEDVSTLLAIVSDPAPRLRTLRPDLSEDVEEAVASALNADERCPSAQALSRHLAAAARRSVGVAEPDDVAAFVQSLMGDKLAERRRRVVEVLKLREQMGRLAVTSGDAMFDTPSAPPRVAALPPAAPAADATVVDATVTETLADELPAAPVPAIEPPTATATVTVTTPKPFRALSDRRRLWVGAAAAGLGLGAIVAIAVAASRDAQDTESPSAAELPRAPTSPSAVATAPPTTAAQPPPAASVAPSGSLEVKSDVPVSALIVNGRRVPIGRPSREIEVELPGSERKQRVIVEAKSVDGRYAKIIVEPGEPSATLKFPRSGGRAPSGQDLMKWE
jgi:serine/threonine-protein kinase